MAVNHILLEMKKEFCYKFQENQTIHDAATLEKIASIDIGSNTLRLLIAEKTGGKFRVLFRDREIVRLGKNFHPDRFLSMQAIETAMNVLKRFKKKADQEGVTQILSFGTGVLREARNSAIFLDRIEKEINMPVRIITGPEEARLMAKGVLSLFPSGLDDTVIFDMGGGSTEFVFMKDGEMVERLSLPLGVVVLTERFFKSDPPGRDESEFLKGHCQNILEKNLTKNDIIKNLIGTAGTVTTLAAMVKKLIDYDPDQINGTVLTQDRLRGLSEELIALPLDQRAKLAGLEPGRADVIVAGLLMVLEILDHFCQKNLLVSDAGLLEGMII